MSSEKFIFNIIYHILLDNLNKLLGGSYIDMYRKLPLLLQNRRNNWFISETPV